MWPTYGPSQTFCGGQINLWWWGPRIAIDGAHAGPMQRRHSARGPSTIIACTAIMHAIWCWSYSGKSSQICNRIKVSFQNILMFVWSLENLRKKWHKWTCNRLVHTPIWREMFREDSSQAGQLCQWQVYIYVSAAMDSYFRLRCMVCMQPVVFCFVYPVRSRLHGTNAVCMPKNDASDIGKLVYSNAVLHASNGSNTWGRWFLSGSWRTWQTKHCLFLSTFCLPSSVVFPLSDKMKFSK